MFDIWKTNVNLTKVVMNDNLIQGHPYNGIEVCASYEVVRGDHVFVHYEMVGAGNILCVYLIYCIRVNIEQNLQVHIVQATSKITSSNISPTRYVEIKIQL
jgi:hypothetical protein